MLSWYIPPMNENDKDEDGGYFSNIDGYSGVIFFT